MSTPIDKAAKSLIGAVEQCLMQRNYRDAELEAARIIRRVLSEAVPAKPVPYVHHGEGCNPALDAQLSDENAAHNKCRRLIGLDD